MLDEEIFLKQLGRNLQKVRKLRGVTQESVALDASIDRAYISEIENGHKNPSAVTLKKIALVLDCDLADLLN